MKTINNWLSWGALALGTFSFAYVFWFGLVNIDSYLWGILGQETTKTGTIIAHLDSALSGMSYMGMVEDRPTFWGSQYFGTGDALARIQSYRALSAKLAASVSEEQDQFTREYNEARDVAGLKYLIGHTNVSGWLYVATHSWAPVLTLVLAILAYITSQVPRLQKGYK